MTVNPLTASILSSLVAGGVVSGGVAGASYLKNLFSNILKYQVNESLVTMSRPLQVEPMCIIDSNLRTNEVLSDVQQTVLNLFAGFYVQSIALSMLNKEVNVMDRIGRFGTQTGMQNESSLKKDMIKEIKNVFSDNKQLSTAALSKEDYSQNSFKSLNESLDKANSNPFTGEKYNHSLEDNNNNTNYIKDIKDDAKLSIGKIIGISIKDSKTIDGKVNTVEVMVPIAIRLMSGFLRNDQIVEFFAIKDYSAIDRKIAYQTGRLSFWKDIIFLRDVYNQFRRNLIRDKSGSFKATIDKQAQTTIDQLNTKSESLVGDKRATGITSNFIVASSTTKAIEDKLRIKMTNFKQRNDFFNSAGIMTYVDIDDNYRMATIYFHGVDRPMELSFNDLKKSSNKDPNIGDIIQALTLGQPPRLF